MTNQANVIGVNMVKFEKPGRNEPYEIMASKAITGALHDAGIDLSEVQQAYASYVYGDSTCGQTALYQVGMTGIPIINVNNNCSSGSTALYMARQAVESGSADCVLAFGFEEMKPGALGENWSDRTSPFQWIYNRFDQLNSELPEGPVALKVFGAAALEYLKKYDASPEIFGKVAVKSRKHAVNNPYSLFTEEIQLEDVMNSPDIYPGLTRLMACPPTCGAAAVIVCSDSFAKKHNIGQTVKIVAQSMTTDLPNSIDSDNLYLVGYGMTNRAAKEVFEKAGIGPEDIDVIELHDCFTPNEVITYEGLGLCEEGEAEKLINDGDNTYGGKYVINPSGGLMSKGHPLGATGLAQCTELVWQLRGEAGNRQVENARTALQHNLGLGGACVVTLYQKG
ncbi:lipid-transfer protein [Bacillus sp. DTU_2020_1000418_1_SI_GHA_SEK_038]|uniref:lipid-transfer protein n=1 Tax=Bacillus sp. DTU_2020_1000418_1_SI_GHA_SEK_038 TaxID=3077585 RepID=UPI0028F103D4|nr:lipid-transfer protein [Bacillus sp. DTU_2020_1000418_1_SI_GHA_SEK_038]WNS76165.1 lipid-transfer protein [Bacillus sp. DTU_2020_1000418_1_SI_GHA_SEK_038]